MDPSTRPNEGQEPSGRGPSLTQQLRDEGRERMDSTRRSAARQVEGIADAVDAARVQLDQTQPTLARYTASLADGIERVAARLRDASLEDLARDARGFAARNPGLFVLGSAALGVVLARFLKASTAQSESTRERPYGYGSFGSDDRRGAAGTQSASPTAQYVPPEEGEPAVGSSYSPPH